MAYDQYVSRIKDDLKAVSSADKAQAMQRFFPEPIHCIGAQSQDIQSVIRGFQSDNASLEAEQMLAISEQLLHSAEYSEEVLLAFGLITKFVKKSYSDELLSRFEYWLENYATNWAHVDDLCIKTIYQFLMARPHLIEKTQPWAKSQVSWCRRASNVVWVKFVRRKIGKSIYHLDTQLIFDNCSLLNDDEDAFVQKSIGWLLKVTSQHHPQAVIQYLQQNSHKMQRSTIRTAMEKLAQSDRKIIL